MALFIYHKIAECTEKINISAFSANSAVKEIMCIVTVVSI
jgi:hypothetical protein